MNKFFYCAMAGSFLCLAALGLQAQNASSGMTIADNQVIKISGTIELKHLGYTTHVLLEVAQPMRADFADGEQKTVHEIEIFSPNLSSELKSHLHEKAVVEGRIMLEDASPYYFNGVALHADRITIGQKFCADSGAKADGATAETQNGPGSKASRPVRSAR